MIEAQQAKFGQLGLRGSLNPIARLPILPSLGINYDFQELEIWYAFHFFNCPMSLDKPHDQAGVHRRRNHKKELDSLLSLRFQTFEESQVMAL